MPSDRTVTPTLSPQAGRVGPAARTRRRAGRSRATLSASPRSVGAMPAAASRGSGSAAASFRLWRSILRRWPKAAAVTAPSVLTEQAGDGCSIGANSTTAEATVGGGVKASGFTVNSRRGPRAPLGDHRQPPVGLDAGRGDDALGHLLLEHQHHAPVPGRPGLALEPADEQQRGDVVGQVGDDHRLGRRCRRQARASRPRARRRNAPRAGPDSARRWPPAPAGSARRAPRRRRARHPPGRARASARRARPDLDHGAARERAGGAGDAPRQVEIEDEVLAQALLGGQPERADRPRPAAAGRRGSRPRRRGSWARRAGRRGAAARRARRRAAARR